MLRVIESLSDAVVQRRPFKIGDISSSVFPHGLDSNGLLATLGMLLNHQFECAGVLPPFLVDDFDDGYVARRNGLEESASGGRNFVPARNDVVGHAQLSYYGET